MIEIVETTVFETLAGDTGQRIDIVLANELDGLSRSSIQQLITRGFVTVDGKTVQKNYLLRPGDIITCQLPQPVPYEAAAEPIPLSIVFEDDELIVVNKPRGMVVHPAPGHYSGTLVNALLHHCGGSLSGINGCLRPGIVHRIDKDTSGLLVAAKTDRAHQSLAAQLAAHTMQRTYHAIIWHNLKNDCLSVNQPIGRSASDRKKMAVMTKPGVKSRPAVTHVTVLERYGRFTLIEAQLETGRTHQIRVHMSSMGHPLLGDTVYGSQKQPYHLEGQVLHAKSLGFEHPTTGETLFFDSEWPPYFAETVENIRRDCGVSNPITTREAVSYAEGLYLDEGYHA